MAMCNSCINNNKCDYKQYYNNREQNLKEATARNKHMRKENLSNRLYYDEIAVEYHKKEGNLCQIEYFENNVAMARKILGR